MFLSGGLIVGIITIVMGIIILVALEASAPWPRIIAFLIGVYIIIVGLLTVIATLL